MQIDTGRVSEVPAEVLLSPALLFLYYRTEQILGIKAGSDALIKLNDYIENNCGYSFVENPAAYERLLASREHIFEISNLLTINETYFFREGIHFEILLRFLPKYAIENRPLRICSAATSTGCEAYSITMLLDYQSRNGLALDFSVDAFDVSAEAIETAKNARYTSNTIRNDGAAWKYILDSYLLPQGNEYVVTQNIRDKVNFFQHNIMRSLDRQYDIIFFRNALIYFTPKNRLIVLDGLTGSLFNEGLLFTGISETSLVKHPLLANRFLSEAFYFQKASISLYHGQLEWDQNPASGTKAAYSAKASHAVKRESYTKPPHSAPAKKVRSVPDTELQISIEETAEILQTEEGRPNAEGTLEILGNKEPGFIPGCELAACAVYFLNIQDFNSADLVLSYLENHNSGSLTRFLRGEYYFLRGSEKEAEHYFEEAAIKDKTFWPAFYRIASLASEGNRTRYEYKIKKTIESIELSKNPENGIQTHYECFMGGFSPDYFRRILEKKLA